MTKEQHAVHYAAFVPATVANSDKTKVKSKVSCEVCIQTLKECDEDESELE